MDVSWPLPIELDVSVHSSHLLVNTKCLSPAPLKRNPANASVQVVLLLRLNASVSLVDKAATRNMSLLSKLMETNCHWLQFKDQEQINK